MTKRKADSTRYPRAYLLLALALVGILWFIYFDSYSLVKRQQWSREFVELQAENDRLKAEIQALEARLEAPPTDDEIEKIAREKYGMRREGETVYRVAE